MNSPEDYDKPPFPGMPVVRDERDRKMNAAIASIGVAACLVMIFATACEMISDQKSEEAPDAATPVVTPEMRTARP